MALAIVLYASSCKDNGNPVNGDPPGLPTPIYPSPYSSPVWRSDGRITFNWTKVLTIDRGTGAAEIDRDSSGFWIMNADGTGLKKLLSYGLLNPAWSFDGQWIAFGAGQIYKMWFTGTAFDTTTLTQLTFEGRNFFPAWSPDGQWIAYDRSLADESGPAGVWIMKPDGSQKSAVFGGAFPAWSADGKSLLAVIGTSPTSVWKRFVRYYPFEIVQPETLSAVFGNDNRHPRYSPDGTKIAFWSQAPSQVPQLWVMNADGTNPRQLTTEGADLFSWSPDGRQLVYVHYSYRRADLNNGTLWIMNADGSNKLQLTFNHGLTFVP
jgi:Tol biopolymer transport system component